MVLGGEGSGEGTGVDRRAGCHNLGTAAFLGGSFFVVGGCPVPCRMPVSSHPFAP